MERTCSEGHIYDADQFPSCPYCNRNTKSIQFTFGPNSGSYGGTVAPGGFGGGATVAPGGHGGDIGPTVAPGGNGSSYGGTVAPDGHTSGRSSIGETVMPDSIRRRIDREKDSRTVGQFKRKLGYEPVVGWLVCVEGPEVGKDYRLFGRINTIGRSEDNDVVLAQEHTVSQKNHVRLAYDSKHNSYQLIPGDGSNLTYLNDEPLYSHTSLKAYDVLELGDTKLIFVPLCTDQFRWPTTKAGGTE